MARIPETKFRAEPADHAIAFRIYPANATTDDKNIAATITYDPELDLWIAQPAKLQGPLSEVLAKTTGAPVRPDLDAMPPLHAAALLSAGFTPPGPKEPRHEATVRGTIEQLDYVRRIVGEDNVSPVVVGDNGIAAFWAEGPNLLEMLRNIMETERGDPQADWEAMSPLEKDALLSMAAGSADWATETQLDSEYVEDWLNGDPEMLDLIRRTAKPPEPASQG